MTQPLLEVEALRFRHRDATSDAGPALDDVSLTVTAGELLAIVGPSGSGKTTLLRCVAGLEMPTSGAIRLSGQPVTEVPDALAVVFQDYSRSLYPWMTVAANVKQVLTIVLAVIIFKLQITPMNLLGISLTLLGGAVFAKVELDGKRDAQEQRQRQSLSLIQPLAGISEEKRNLAKM